MIPQIIGATRVSKIKAIRKETATVVLPAEMNGYALLNGK